MPLLSSCNIACGGHAGDVATMKSVALLAKQYQVKVGAHPSYPDKENFGRSSLKITSKDLIQSIREQVIVFASVLRKENIPFHHIKPHGALYNDIAKDEELAMAFLTAIKEYREKVFLYVPYGSVIEKLSLEKGFKIKYEAFADRNYNNDLSLVSRNKATAVLQSPEKVLEHVKCIASQGKVKTISEDFIKIKVDTYCIHGDTPSALQILTYLSKELPRYNFQIKK